VIGNSSSAPRAQDPKATFLTLLNRGIDPAQFLIDIDDLPHRKDIFFRRMFDAVTEIESDGPPLPLSADIPTEEITPEMWVKIRKHGYGDHVTRSLTFDQAVAIVADYDRQNYGRNDHDEPSPEPQDGLEELLPALPQELEELPGEPPQDGDCPFPLGRATDHPVGNGATDTVVPDLSSVVVLEPFKPRRDEGDIGQGPEGLRQEPPPDGSSGRGHWVGGWQDPVWIEDRPAFDLPLYAFPDPATIPPRRWLYGRHYMRGSVGATIGAPGRAKSTIAMTEVVSMALGRDLLNDNQPLLNGQMKVAYLNGEENQHELDRRLAAIMQRYRLTPNELRGRLWVVSLRDKPVMMARRDARGALSIEEHVVAGVEKWCDDQMVDVVVFDPLVSFHGLDENDNGAMDLLLKKAFGRVAGEDRRSVELVVHPRKAGPGQIATTVDDMRGASAQLGAVRMARTVNFMTGEEAERLAIRPDETRSYVRVEGGKSNPGPPENATWRKIEVEHLPNEDVVAVVVPWKPPDPFESVTSSDMHTCRAMAKSGTYRDDMRSPEWFGWAVAKTIGVDIAHGRENDPQKVVKIKNILKKWKANGVIKVERREDEWHKPRGYIVAGDFNDGDNQGERAQKFNDTLEDN
jgi:hypothetical protein